MGEIEVFVPVASAEFRDIGLARRGEVRTLGFLWNDKPNGDILLRTLERLLKEELGVSNTIFRKKPFASSSAPEDVIEELSGKSDLVILAVGDCGSCTSWLIHDAVELEKRGTPTVSILTDEFSSLGKMEAQALSMPRLPTVIIPHPVGGIKEREVEDKAKKALGEILKAMKGE